MTTTEDLTIYGTTVPAAALYQARQLIRDIEAKGAEIANLVASAHGLLAYLNDIGERIHDRAARSGEAGSAEEAFGRLSGRQELFGLLADLSESIDPEVSYRHTLNGMPSALFAQAVTIARKGRPCTIPMPDGIPAVATVEYAGIVQGLAVSDLMAMEGVSILNAEGSPFDEDEGWTAIVVASDDTSTYRAGWWFKAQAFEWRRGGDHLTSGSMVTLEPCDANGERITGPFEI